MTPEERAHNVLLQVATALAVAQGSVVDIQATDVVDAIDMIAAAIREAEEAARAEEREACANAMLRLCAFSEPVRLMQDRAVAAIRARGPK